MDSTGTEGDRRTARGGPPVGSLGLTAEEQGEWTVIHVSGELNFQTIGEFREDLDGLIQAGRSRIVIELSALDYCDSTGVSCLFDAWRQARRSGGDLYLLRSPDHLLRILTITGLGRYLHDLPAVPDTP